MFLVVFITILFIAGCSEEANTDKELANELKNLSDEELHSLIQDGESEENKALAGEASKWQNSIKVGKKKYPLQKVTKTAKETFQVRQKEFLKTITNPVEKYQLESLLYSKSKQKKDDKGNILMKLKSGKTVALSGYLEEKRNLISIKKSPVVWKEIERLNSLSSEEIEKSLEPVSQFIMNLKEIGETCETHLECISKSCQMESINIAHTQVEGISRCVRATCEDGVQNQNEEGIDCGGVCQREENKYCFTPSRSNMGGGSSCEFHYECFSMRCEEVGNGEKECTQATCSDGIINQRESDIDCGGPCGNCILNQRCLRSDDCQSGICYEEVCVLDNLNTVNSHFYRNDYNPQGFMFWGNSFYEQGSFPFFPYLTTIKDQGDRPSCQSFSAVGATEILLMDKHDLSEQNHRYNLVYNQAYPNQVGINIGSETQWPYNAYCNPKFKTYYSELLNKRIPCSDTEHQGIANGNNFDPYYQIQSTTEGKCVVVSTLLLYQIPQESITLSLAHVLNNLKYPISFVINIVNPNEEEDGFVQEGFFSSNPWNYQFTTRSCDWDNPCPEEESCFGDVSMCVPRLPDGGLHSMLLVGFIHKNLIPSQIRENPNYMDENYFIVKNSWGVEFGDGGFLYIPESMLQSSILGATSYKYDFEGLAYAGCPYRETKGVI